MVKHEELIVTCHKLQRINWLISAIPSPLPLFTDSPSPRKISKHLVSNFVVSLWGPLFETGLPPHEAPAESLTTGSCFHTSIGHLTHISTALTLALGLLIRC